MAKYHDEIAAAGVSDEQLSAAVEAIKNGDLSVLPDELRPFALEVMAKLKADDTTSSVPENTSNNTAAQK